MESKDILKKLLPIIENIDSSNDREIEELRELKKI